MNKTTMQAWMPLHFVVPLKKPCDPINMLQLRIHCLTSQDPATAKLAQTYIDAIEATDQIIERMME